MPWTGFDVSATLPTSVTTLVGALADAVQAITSIQKANVPNKKLSAIADAANDLDATTTVIQTALVQITEGLESLLAAGKVHVLYVPIHKPVAASGGSATSAIAGDVILSDTVKQLYAHVKNSPYLGNQGFYRQVMESITDPGDPGRPTFGDDDYIGCHVLLTGEAQLSTLLKSATVLDKLFSGNQDTFSSRLVPVAQNVKAAVVGSTSGPSVGVKLTWDAPKTIYSPKYYPISFSPRRAAIVRSTNARAVMAKTVTDLFGTANLKKGLKSPDGLSEVVTIVNGENSGYYDDVAPNTSGTYYAIAWEIEAVETTTTTNLGFDKLSNVVKVTSQVIAPPPPSIKPDWTATVSPIELLPALSSTLRSIKEQVDILLNRTTLVSTSLDTQKVLLEQAIASYSAKAEQLSHTITTLTASLEANANLHTAAFVGTGGMNLFAETLYALLFDTSDTTRPTFDGNQFVTGAVLLYGGNEVTVAAIHQVLALLFGSSDTDPAVEALQSIDAFFTQEEAVVFGPDLQPLPSSSLTTTDPLTGETTSSIDPATGKPTKPNTTPVISEDGTPVSTDSADNPNQGFTNKKPITC
jgi:hypothetical protein